MPSVVALYIILIHILAVYVVCRRLIKRQGRLRMIPAIFPPLPGHMICKLTLNVFETNAIRKKIMDDKRHYT